MTDHQLTGQSPGGKREKYNLIGKPYRRVDGRDKVTGRTLFADDLTAPRMVHMKLVRSTVPHARIKNIDTSKAAAMPGVVGFLTGKEMTNTFGVLPVSQDEHALCPDKVRFVGDPIAFIVAERAQERHGDGQTGRDLARSRVETGDPLGEPAVLAQEVAEREGGEDDETDRGGAPGAAAAAAATMKLDGYAAAASGVAQAAAVPAAVEPTADPAEMIALQERLDAAEAEVESLREALETANSRRGQALKKVDAATAQVDDLLSILEPKSEVG